jgi:hypothetical protein
MSHKIFISYRRFDTAGTTGRLHDALCEAFGDQNVFRDVHDIPAGVDFREVLERELESCSIVLVMIGQHYTSIKDEQGNLRLHNPKDFVHMEVASAMEKNKIVVPVLVDGAVMPSPASLPATLQPLVNFNAVIISHDRWKSDVAVLIKKLEYHLGPVKSRHASGSSPVAVGARPGFFKRYVGPMMMGAILTVIFFVAFALAIPTMVDEGETTADLDNISGLDDGIPGEENTNTTYSASLGPPASYDAPQERISPKEIEEPELPIAGKQVEQVGGYGVPVTGNAQNQKKDYWGFDEKRTLEDQLVGVWEQTYPELPAGMFLRNTFTADGVFKNSYNQQLYYNVVQNVIQMNGTNVYQVRYMNEAESEMEWIDIQGGGLICKFRRIQ